MSFKYIYIYGVQDFSTTKVEQVKSYLRLKKESKDTQKIYFSTINVYIKMKK